MEKSRQVAMETELLKEWVQSLWVFLPTHSKRTALYLCTVGMYLEVT